MVHERMIEELRIKKASPKVKATLNDLMAFLQERGLSFDESALVLKCACTLHELMEERLTKQPFLWTGCEWLTLEEHDAQ